MARRIAIGIVVSLLVLVVNARLDNDRVFNTGPTTQRCEEDMPCWDCSTMGNHICGHHP